MLRVSTCKFCWVSPGGSPPYRSKSESLASLSDIQGNTAEPSAMEKKSLFICCRAGMELSEPRCQPESYPYLLLCQLQKSEYKINVAFCGVYSMCVVGLVSVGTER